MNSCIQALGGDQFKLPEQGKQLASFYSHFYIALNAGTLIGIYIYPIFRWIQNSAKVFQIMIEIPSQIQETLHLCIAKVFIFQIWKFFVKMTKCLPLHNFIIQKDYSNQCLLQKLDYFIIFDIFAETMSIVLEMIPVIL